MLVLPLVLAACLHRSSEIVAIPDGYRMVSIPMPAATLPSSLPLGTRVDVLADSAVVLRNVEIVRTRDAEPNVIVSFLLPRADAERLAVASAGGRLLTLRSAIRVTIEVIRGGTAPDCMLPSDPGCMPARDTLR